jgi:hypothetical protein
VHRRAGRRGDIDTVMHDSVAHPKTGRDYATGYGPIKPRMRTGKAMADAGAALVVLRRSRRAAA